MRAKCFRRSEAMRPENRVDEDESVICEMIVSNAQ